MGESELEWNGRELVSYTDEALHISYGYNADGIRTYRNINIGWETERHEYTLSGSQIIKETVFKNGVEQYILVYVYDETGAPIGLKHRTPAYAEDVYDCFFFEKNLQGDIIAIYNASGTKIGTYAYDAWGASTCTTLTRVGIERLVVSRYNPFKYRGYYYCDGWYYLQSRYYSPGMGRFINADTYVNANGDMIGYNMFVYCSNNPIVRIDEYGQSWKNIKDFLYNIGESIVEELEYFYDALTLDIGLGLGAGFSVECADCEAAALVRSDAITIRKNAGEDMMVGYADESYVNLELGGASFPRGEKKFYDFDRTEKKNEQMEVTYNFDLSAGGTICIPIFCVAITVEIGFDYGHYIENRFLN